MNAPDDARVTRRLTFAVLASAIGGIAFTLTYGSSVITLFVSDLGFSKSQVGYVRALLFLLGLVGPFFMPLLERFGFRRSFLLFYAARYLALAALAATPALLAASGLPAAIALVLGATVVFGLLRALAETAYLPWQHEFVPSAVFGRFEVAVILAGSVCSILALAGASRLLAASADPGTFTLLVLVAAAFGLIGVVLYAFVSGGDPRPAVPRSPLVALPPVAAVLRDRLYVRFLVSNGFVLLASTSLTTFLPLFLRESAALTVDFVVLLDGVTLVGSLAFLFLWGVAADRFGGKPVLVTGLLASLLVTPAWLFIPPGLPITRILSIAFSAWQGAAGAAVQIGAMQLLFTSLVTAERRNTYLPVYYLSISVAMAVSPLVAGWLLELFGTVLAGHPYAPLFASAAVFFAAALLLVNAIPNPRGLRTREFLSLLMRGNILQATWSLLRYGLALDEGSRLELARGMGDARSAFHSPRLVAALDDPSFLIRHEAVLALARSRRHPGVAQALVHVLEGGDRELHLAAAWALGRVGDRAAAPALRRCLEADDPRLAASAARSLGMLRDAESAPALLARLADPSRGELHAACASALSWIGVCGAIPVLLESLEHAGSRASDAGEIALAVARLVGREDAFVKLWRRSRREPLADDSPGGLRARRGRQPDGHAEDLAAIRSFCDGRLARDPPAGQEIRILRLSCSA